MRNILEGVIKQISMIFTSGYFDSVEGQSKL